MWPDYYVHTEKLLLSAVSTLHENLSATHSLAYSIVFTPCLTAYRCLQFVLFLGHLGLKD